jgi:diguanylate cyclase (GGDEF)-like protein
MASFKFKLVAYFAVVALLPVLGAYYGFASLAKKHETSHVDNRLRADNRAAVAGYAQQLDAAERRAQEIPIGQAVARLVPGIDPSDTLVAVKDGIVLNGPRAGDALLLSPGIPAQVRLGGEAFRGVLTNELSAGGGIQFASLDPQHEIDASVAATRWKVAGALALVVLVFGFLVYMLGVSIVRTLDRLAKAADEIAQGRFRERVRVRGRDEFSRVAEAFNRMAAQLEQRIIELEQERRRTREVTVRFGKALTVTHDVDLLLNVIVETVVEATGANGGLVLGRKGELARAGDPDGVGERLELPLIVSGQQFGKVVLTGPAFDEEQVDTASSLAAQAVVALENAQLHRIVEWQALVDPLTGLANRRSLEESLQEEVSRAERFGGDVCLVLADLDRFKRINDRHGHPTGDRALRTFALTLRDLVREIDSAGRWGGEEFALVLPGTDVAGGIALAERIRESLAGREIRSASGDLVRLTASFGVASYSESGSLVALVEDADDALYWAKREGRDRVASAADVARR